MSFRDFQKNLEKSRKEQQVVNQLRAEIKVLEDKRDGYAEEAKKELKKGNKAQYAAMVSLMKYCIFNISQVEAMLANYTIAKEMADIQNLNRAFNKSLRHVLRDVVRVAGKINVQSTQKLFDKALQQSNQVSVELRDCLKHNNCSFIDSINDMSEITDEEISKVLGMDIEAEENKLDDMLDQMQEELVAPEKRVVKVGGKDEPVKPAPAKEEKPAEPAPREDKDEVVEETKDNIFVYHGKDYVKPSLSLLSDSLDQTEVRKQNEADMASISELIRQKFYDFGVHVELENTTVGASISRLEYRLQSNTQVSSLIKYAPDLSLATGRKIRLLLPIPGKTLIGVEVENATRELLTLKQMLSCYTGKEDDVNLAIGFDIERKPVYAKLSSLPHLLVGGATGAGKSVFLSDLITTILYECDPHDLRLALIDFKRVEMNIYNGIPFLVGGKSIDEFDDALSFLYALVEEMERRYDVIAKKSCRNLQEYNCKVEKEQKMPYILMIIDEYGDMVSSGGYKEAQVLIQRLVQKARAAGIHLIIATQRPSVKVIDGVIKANLPSRAAFAVSSHVDSLTVLDQSGAEDLIGKGDMLFQIAGTTTRLQAPFVSTDEVARTVEAIKKDN